jgi:hypothetical protein
VRVACRPCDIRRTPVVYCGEFAAALIYYTFVLSIPRSGNKECLLLLFALLNLLTLNETLCCLTSKGKKGNEV